ncbi:UNVERIFIED_CONTAM: hypothetical protein Sangu_2923100 [Sesamum angustifolium]|uniref:Uncharacterized protein n=1 Tax=Sesamum angustifolium TaxID=2727405 RepID=A0AAW2IMX1_9LAMI
MSEQASLVLHSIMPAGTSPTAALPFAARVSDYFPMAARVSPNPLIISSFASDDMQQSGLETPPPVPVPMDATSELYIEETSIWIGVREVTAT